MPKDEILRKIFIEEDLSNFDDFFDKDWFSTIDGLVENTRLDSIVGNFAVNWWGNARAFILPFLLVTGVTDVINVPIPHSFKLSPRKTWDEYSKLDEFNVALWKLSENIYCSLFFAYENLIVNILKQITGSPLRVTDQKSFKCMLIDTFNEQVAHKVWHQTLVYTARESRNSIVHNGGKATTELRKVKPLPVYIQGEDVVISAKITRNLYNDLKPLVYELVVRSVEKVK